MSIEDLAARRPETLAHLGDERPSLHRPALDSVADSLHVQKGQRLTSTLDHAGVGLAEIDAEGRLLRVNTHLSALMGYRPEELIGRSIFDETCPEDAEIDRNQFQRQVAGEIDRYTLEKRLRRKDGSYVWASISSSSVLDPVGHFLYAVRVQYDISARKQAEAALARGMEEQTALFDFTEAIQRAYSREQIYAAALDAIQRALRCDRASILLTDAAGTMRFVAARGLSETYQRAVEGHSPWSADAPDPKPITIADLCMACGVR